MKSSIIRLGLIALLMCGSISFGTGCSSVVASTVTFGELSQNGAALFSSLCALCHGQTGGGGFGPPVIGVNANLWKYYTASGLLYFVQTAMPFNAPGSLTHQQYLDDMGFLLVSNGFVATGQGVPEDNLVSVVLPQPTAPAPVPSTTTATTTAPPTATTITTTVTGTPTVTARTTSTLPATTSTTMTVTTSTAVSTTPTTSPLTTPTGSSTGQTFQSLASQGKTVFSSSCAVCHGNNGQGGIGPPLWGSSATLGTYNGTVLFNKNAQDMLNFISTRMPLTAPGSLSSEQYIDVLAYILVQSNLVSGTTVFNQSQLSSISLS